MITAAFARSQVVYLKSGGPGMTIKNVIPTANTDAAERGPLLVCTWFQGKKLCEKSFFADLITPTDPKAPAIVPPMPNETQKDRD